MADVDRRTMLAATALAAAAPAVAAPNAGRTYVLVHGAWHGGWCWRHVADRLCSAGNRVFTPTLTGLGERSHLLGPDVTIRTHIADVVNVLTWEELRDVVLVGHSYGGMVVSGAAATVPDRIARLVYLDAVLPTPGRPLAAPGTPRPPGPGMLAPSDPSFGVPASQAANIAWLKRRLTPHPTVTWFEPFPADLVPPDRPRTFIQCVSPRLPAIDAYAARARSEPGWRFVTIAAGHDAMVSAPDELTALLLAA